MLAQVKRILAGVRNQANRLAYRRFLERLRIDDRAVLLDQQHGLSADGNLHYIVRELANADRYGTLKLYFAYERHHGKRIREQLDRRGIDAIPLKRSTRNYYRKLASSRFLVTDTSFPPALVKREGQVIWNTWHGTPLKTLGRSERDEALQIGNVQKNLALADYLSFANEYSADRIIDDYMIAKLSSPTLLFADYPRNKPFNEAEPAPSHAHCIRNAKRTYAYLPTFRYSRTRGAKDSMLDRISSYLGEIDPMLHDDELLFVKLHPAIQASLPIDDYAHIAPFPEERELYDFLSTCDVLITDYSSVLFDFAITGKKVVLFAFDEKNYLRDRGLYLPLSNLPFPVVREANQLVDELRTAKAHDDTGFLEAYAPHRSGKATEMLCRRVFNAEIGQVPEHPLDRHDQPAVLVFAPKLPSDDKLLSLYRTLEKVARGAAVTLAFPAEQAQGRIEVLARLPEQIGYLPYTSLRYQSLRETLASVAMRHRIIGLSRYESSMSDAFNFEARRLFGTARFDSIYYVASDDWADACLAIHLPGQSLTFLEDVSRRAALPDGCLELARQQFARVSFEEF